MTFFKPIIVVQGKLVFLFDDSAAVTLNGTRRASFLTADYHPYGPVTRSDCENSASATVFNGNGVTTKALQLVYDANRQPSADGRASEITTLSVCDIPGRGVATLVDRPLPSGVYRVSFDAKTLSSGVYFYHLRSGNFVRTKK
jgi:hypothetical protein